jgi:hypothetical protein
MGTRMHSLRLAVDSVGLPVCECPRVCLRVPRSADECALLIRSSAFDVASGDLSRDGRTEAGRVGEDRYEVSSPLHEQC